MFTFIVIFVGLLIICCKMLTSSIKRMKMWKYCFNSNRLNLCAPLFYTDLLLFRRRSSSNHNAPLDLSPDLSIFLFSTKSRQSLNEHKLLFLLWWFHWNTTFKCNIFNCSYSIDSLIIIVIQWVGTSSMSVCSSVNVSLCEWVRVSVCMCVCVRLRAHVCVCVCVYVCGCFFVYLFLFLFYICVSAYVYVGIGLPGQ